PRPMQLHGPEPDLHAMALGVIGQRSIGGEQGQLSGLLRPLVEGLDHPAPGFLLAVVDLAEIKHLPLHHLAAGAALALDNAPVAANFETASLNRLAFRPLPTPKFTACLPQLRKSGWSRVERIIARVEV